jgi:hypothetical protein
MGRKQAQKKACKITGKNIVIRGERGEWWADDDALDYLDRRGRAYISLDELIELLTLDASCH